jgi:hypothetical protein
MQVNRQQMQNSTIIDFKNRGTQRIRVAYILLVSAILLIAGSVFLIIMQLQDIKDSEKANREVRLKEIEHKNELLRKATQVADTKDFKLEELKDTNENDLYNVISKISFVILIAFIAQALLRLYRYNILKGDYYLSCSDALKLSKEMDAETQAKFEGLITVLISEKIALSTPRTPSFPGLNTGNKA